MSERIRQLEDALAIFQKGISDEKHPLLRDELLTIKFGPEVRRTVDDEHTRDIMSQTIDALGTLTVGEYGEIKYIGRSGSSEVCRAYFVCQLSMLILHQALFLVREKEYLVSCS